jgi:hypothetical protein
LYSDMREEGNFPASSFMLVFLAGRYQASAQTDTPRKYTNIIQSTHHANTKTFSHAHRLARTKAHGSHNQACMNGGILVHTHMLAMQKRASSLKVCPPHAHSSAADSYKPIHKRSLSFTHTNICTPSEPPTGVHAKDFVCMCV